VGHLAVSVPVDIPGAVDVGRATQTAIPQTGDIRLNSSASLNRALLTADVSAAGTGGETHTVMRTTGENHELSKLIEAHLPLVKHIVFQVAVHFPRHVDRDELARAGALGLVEAARRYDESRGVPFDRFAAQRIRGAILDAVRAADWAPRSVRTLARKLESVEQRLASELGRVPSPTEMASALGMTGEELCRLQDRLFRSVVLALEHEVNEDSEEDLTLVDVLSDRSTLEPLEELESRELHAYLRDAVGLLPERQRFVIVGYFLEGRTSQELARFLGVTESRISQLRSEALVMLRDGIEAQYDGPIDSVNGTGRVARRKASYAAAIAEASEWRSRLGGDAPLDADGIPVNAY
jgi:RNA polymerase sigma factor FliA